MQTAAQKIVSLSQAKVITEEWKTSGESFVFTNGCFDIVHLGHLDYLEKASQLADHLVLGINSDLSISKIKGEDRPIINEASRTRLMAALFFVDLVIVFGDDTPQHLIETLTPNILVKGNDYSIDQIVGADHVIQHGGDVKTIELVDGYSTSAIVQKIKST